ncbi:MAG: Uma2 family endonuclease [Cyanobacteria bacterium P01_H01_bin.152]
MTALLIKVPPSTVLTDDQFYDLCRANPDIKIERTAHGELLFMPPTGGETGKRNAKLTSRFVVWNEATNAGEVFDSSTCFKLPNGAERSPDVAWIARDRWAALPLTSREKFPPIAPDFVLELMSPSDSLSAAQAKMQEYLENGVRLGWLMNRQRREVEVYQIGQAKETLINPTQLLGGDILPDFVLNMVSLW